ncbi:RES family NAD+ phosphorylase [Streptomyces sp. NPDC058964]|uniref:RES family NAD+ phosphorylase n=1 Tax=Streptomyces sp. NPDC058964 TaxID=3346681 RepID=UPI003694D53D
MARGARLPEKGTAEPRRVVWQAGKVLYRVHSRRRDADRFNTTVQDHHFGGARFDSTPNDEYVYLYAAPRPVTALVERLVRDLRFDGMGNPRILPRKEVEGKRLSQVRLARDVTLVSLRSVPDLNAVQQSDRWLVDSNASEYAFTRRWGHWLRAEADWAQGFVWSSRLDHPNESLVLFDSRADSDLVETTGEPPRELDDPDGLRWLGGKLANYHVEIGPPGGAHASWS